MRCTDEKKYFYDDGVVIDINVILVTTLYLIAVDHFDKKLWFV